MIAVPAVLYRNFASQNSRNDPLFADTIPEKVTYNQNVGPILQKHCMTCHREQGVKEAIQFNTYKKIITNKLYLTIQADINSGRMPPWPVAEGAAQYAEGFQLPQFQDKRGLSDTEKAIIDRWIAQGLAEGEGQSVVFDPLPSETLSGADIKELRMPQPFTPAPVSGLDQYRCFILGPVSDHDLWMTALQVIPSARKVVHHIVLFTPLTAADEATALALDDADPGPGYDCVGSPGENVKYEIIGLSQGHTVMWNPAGTAVKIKAKKKIIYQVHYNISDGAVPDQSVIRLKTFPTKSGLTDAKWYNPGYQEGSIPAGKPETIISTIDTSQAWFGSQIRIYGVFPHMHLFGTKLHAEYSRSGHPALLPLIEMKTWDFNWQAAYFFQKDQVIDLQEKDKLKITCHYDTRNQKSPVLFGEKSTEEMCYLFVYGTVGENVSR